VITSKVDRLSQQKFLISTLLGCASFHPPFHLLRIITATWNETHALYALRKRVGEGCPDRFRRYNEPVFPIALHTCLPLHRIMRFFTGESAAENNKSFELKILHDEKYVLSLLQKTDILRSRNIIDCCEIITSIWNISQSDKMANWICNRLSVYIRLLTVNCNS